MQLGKKKKKKENLVYPLLSKHEAKNMPVSGADRITEQNHRTV